MSRKISTQEQAAEGLKMVESVPRTPFPGLQGRLPAPYRAEKLVNLPENRYQCLEFCVHPGNVGYNYICRCGDASRDAFPLHTVRCWGFLSS